MRLTWILLTLVTLLGCDRNEGSTAAGSGYTCSMHPEVTSASAGDCPKCGMRLVEKK